MVTQKEHYKMSLSIIELMLFWAGVLIIFLSVLTGNDIIGFVIGVSEFLVFMVLSENIRQVRRRIE